MICLKKAVSLRGWPVSRFCLNMNVYLHGIWPSIRKLSDAWTHFSAATARNGLCLRQMMPNRLMTYCPTVPSEMWTEQNASEQPALTSIAAKKPSDTTSVLTADAMKMCLQITPKRKKFPFRPRRITALRKFLALQLRLSEKAYRKMQTALVPASKLFRQTTSIAEKLSAKRHLMPSVAWNLTMSKSLSDKLATVSRKKEPEL